MSPLYTPPPHEPGVPVSTCVRPAAAEPDHQPLAFNDDGPICPRCGSDEIRYGEYMFVRYPVTLGDAGGVVASSDEYEYVYEDCKEGHLYCGDCTQVVRFGGGIDFA